MARKNRFTVFDMMDEKGVFEKNPANTCSGAYQGPQQYPKMLYHPLGEYRVTQKAEVIVTPLGPEKVGEQKELISRVVEDREEEEKYLGLGWHDHPAKAIKASGKEAPAMGAVSKESALEAENRRLKEQLEELMKARTENAPVVSRRVA